VNAAVRGLALETSGRVGSVALAVGGRAVVSDTFDYGLSNAARLLPIIDGLCRGQGWKAADLREIYVSIGPGSFTGLRIGTTLAKTLAFATGAAIAAVPTLLVLACNAPADVRDLIVLLDAKRGMIFTARFHREPAGVWLAAEPAHLDTLAAMVSRAREQTSGQTSGPIFLTGEGLDFHRKEIGGDSQIHELPHELWTASAAVVATLGRQMLDRGEATGADRLVPVYVRRPEAEEKADAAGEQASKRRQR
jgi:tRNA threonylcarbamoyladenosine biosynthesis protein TsaB